MNETLRQARVSALTLFVFALVATALMAGVYALTHNIVAANEQAARLAIVSQVLPAGGYDNDPSRAAVTLSAADGRRLGNDGPSQVYIARLGGRMVARVFEATAPNGYAGKIRLLVGVDARGAITGVRVVSHKETPGLGDYIDRAKSDWIDQFNGLALTRDSEWKVKKDGGRFDAMAGATVSPRAVVGAVANTLRFVAAERAKPGQWDALSAPASKPTGVKP